MTQAEALDILKMGHNVFLTGAAGSGKTFLLNQYIQFLKSKKVGVGVTASTGIAATHMGGRTIHSWSGIGIKDRLGKSDLRAMLEDDELRERVCTASVLVIDEISMLHAFRLDLVDSVCRAFKGNARPFGGMQVVLCGDFFQLPPVNRESKIKEFAYASAAWNAMGIKICYLDEQHRQEDADFLRILNNLRKEAITEEDALLLKKRLGATASPSCTKLYTHNADVDAINSFELAKIKEEEKRYEMSSAGPRNLVRALRDSCLAPEDLALKKGAAVMFVKNNFEKGYVNGTLGKISGFDDDGLPVVKINSGREIVAEPASWMLEEGGEALARISQIPLRLAWAITVHKSQGMSLDSAQIDLSKSFEYGMGYVALSRVRTLAGLALSGINGVAFKVNPEVAEFDKEFVRLSEKNCEELQLLGQGEIKNLKREFLKSVVPEGVSLDDKEESFLPAAKANIIQPKKKISTLAATKILLAGKKSIEDIAKERELVFNTILGHIEQLQESGEEIEIEHLRPAQKELEEIEAAIRQTYEGRLAPVYEFLEGKYSYEKIRIAKLFIEL